VTANGSGGYYVNSARAALNVVSREVGGDLLAQFAYVDHELGKQLRRPMARGYPPKIFISYRRESAEHIKWCEDLAGELKLAGYEVMLDELAIPAGKASPELLARFVGQLAAADVALMIITPAATSTEHGIRRWMYEEWYRISALHTWGLLEIVGVIRERKTENPIIGFNPGLDPLIDLSDRNPADRRPVLADHPAAARRGPADRPSMKMSKRSSGYRRAGGQAGRSRAWCAGDVGPCSGPSGFDAESDRQEGGRADQARVTENNIAIDVFRDDQCQVGSCGDERALERPGVKQTKQEVNIGTDEAMPIVIDRPEVGCHAKLDMSGGTGDVVMAADQGAEPLRQRVDDARSGDARRHDDQRAVAAVFSETGSPGYPGPVKGPL
jgi:hypothetical protein